MRQAVILPRFAAPVRAACECRRKTMDLEYKTVVLTWNVQTGDRVKAGDALCEAEMEKCVFEIPAPADGMLAEQCVSDGEACDIRRTIGYIETCPDGN